MGNYDRTKDLVVDPVLVYSTYLGGSGGDYGNSIVVDSSGNAFVAGGTQSTNFPTTGGTYQTTLGSGFNAFVSKLNSTGSALLYSTYLGGNASAGGDSVVVDSNGNAYVTGSTGSNNFPTTLGAYQTTFSGTAAVFVTKLNSTGSALLYSTFLGGNTNDVGYGIAVDTNGNVHVTGETMGGFPTTPGAFQIAPGGNNNIFVTKLNSTGSGLIYSTYLGGTYVSEGLGIAIGINGNAYVTGDTDSSNFQTTLGAFQAVYGGGTSNAFVTELNSTGTSLIYSTYLGGNGQDEGLGIAVDSNGYAYITGFTDSSNFPTTLGVYQATYEGVSYYNDNAFVTKINNTGSALVYSSYLGSDACGLGIAVDSSGDAFVTGFAGDGFPTTANADQAALGGGIYDAFVTEFNSTGSTLVYSTYLGGSGYDIGYGITLDSSGNAYVTGQTGSTDFPTTGGAFQPINGEGYHPAGPPYNGAIFGNTFIAKFALAPPTPTLTPFPYFPSSGTTYIYPSPATGNTATIVYTMAAPGSVKIRVYNDAAQLVETVFENKQEGPQSSIIDTKSLVTGVYLYIVQLNYNNQGANLGSTKIGPKKFVVLH